nr:8-oxo-dGTP diphosphatase [Ardenticatena sp.]
MDQQTDGRYTLVPRTLIFLQRENDILLLRGAAHKWFAGRYNGVGGHVEPGETILEAAIREVREETGASPTTLRLRGIVHITGTPGVLLFVFTGTIEGDLHATTDEGTLEWIPRTTLHTVPLVADLHWLLPRILDEQREIVYATFTFTTNEVQIRTAEGDVATLPLHAE